MTVKPGWILYGQYAGKSGLSEQMYGPAAPAEPDAFALPRPPLEAFLRNE